MTTIRSVLIGSSRITSADDGSGDRLADQLVPLSVEMAAIVVVDRFPDSLEDHGEIFEEDSLSR